MVTDGHRILRLVIITVFKAQGVMLGRRLHPFSKTQVALHLSLNPPIVFVSAPLVNFTALRAPKTLFNYLDSVLVYQISSFFQSLWSLRQLQL